MTTIVIQGGAFQVHEIRLRRHTTWAQFSNRSTHSLAPTIEISEDQLTSLSRTVTAQIQVSATVPATAESQNRQDAEEDSASSPRSQRIAWSDLDHQSSNTNGQRELERETQTEQSLPPGRNSSATTTSSPPQKPRPQHPSTAHLPLHKKLTLKLHKLKSKIKHKWKELKKMNQRAYMGWHPKKVRDGWEEMLEGSGPAFVRTPTPYPSNDRTQYSGGRGSVIPSSERSGEEREDEEEEEEEEEVQRGEGRSVSDRAVERNIK